MSTADVTTVAASRSHRIWSPFVEFAACGLVDEVGFSGLVLSESCGDRAEPVPNRSRVDLDGRVGLDLFSQRRDCDRQVTQFLLALLDPTYAAGVGERDLVEQADPAVGARELRVEGSVKCVDGDRHPVKPGAAPSWRGCSEREFEHV